MDPSASLEEAKIAWRDSWFRSGIPTGTTATRDFDAKPKEKNQQINEAWETFQTAPRANARSSASSEPNWEDLRERFRREQEKRQARDKKERKRAESNENQESKKPATKSNAAKFLTITFLLGILLFPFVKVIGALLIVTALYVYLRDTCRVKNGKLWEKEISLGEIFCVCADIS